MKYENQKDGDWIKVLYRKHKILCCDCGLVHDLTFKIRKNKIYFQAFRNQRSTGQARRHRNITARKEYER